jgi:hypothetical protein
MKTGSLDPADFVTTRFLFHWHIALGQLQYANGHITIASELPEPQTFGRRKKQDGNFWQFAQ